MPYFHILRYRVDLSGSAKLPKLRKVNVFPICVTLMTLSDPHKMTSVIPLLKLF